MPTRPSIAGSTNRSKSPHDTDMLQAFLRTDRAWCSRRKQIRNQVSTARPHNNAISRIPEP